MRKNFIKAVVANADGEIFDLDGYAAVGMAGPYVTPLTMDDTIHMPYGGELMLLPDRRPVLFNMETETFEACDTNPHDPDEAIFPVAVFNSPGYVNSCTCAYEEKSGARILPLFSYGAIGWKNGKFRSAAIQVDSERRQDLRWMLLSKITEGVKRFKKKMPSNRLRAHIEHCALTYGCPAAKNFFLGRYEAPLPTAQKCNAGCMGCISLQKKSGITSPQERISFTPTPEEIAEIALEHILNVKKSVVSFGQGCEGDPILAARVIEPAIKLIRSKTNRGTINMNTNAGKPDVLKKLFEAGLDSVRVSLNSARKPCYDAYFNPKGYAFKDVMKSIDIASQMNKYVSINYLNCPGIVDAPEEINAMMRLLKNHPVNLIQWRNLNIDPVKYYNAMRAVSKTSRPVGVQTVLETIEKEFPKITYGYFNPPKEKFSDKS